MIGSKGQAYAAMKLLQGGVIALVLLGIIYGALQMVKEYEPGSDILTVSGELLASAYSAAGTGRRFTRQAKVKSEFITSESIKQKAGIDDPSLTLNMYCRIPIAKYTDDAGRSGECTDFCGWDSQSGPYGQGPCDKLMIEQGSMIDVCVYCPGFNKCQVVLGTKDCVSS